MSPFTKTDHAMMARALQLAKKGEGLVEPNPMVGCVLTQRNQIIGEGYHRRFGGPHAEVVALAGCSQDPRGATAFVTLEPCCTHGKTPPCTKALIEAGVTRVVVATRDPNPAVRGRGFAQLRRAGCTVSVGLLARKAEELIAPFATHTLLGRPFVIAKWAQSLDGKLATRRGESKWISGLPARKMVHRLRSRVDAILVGSTTVLSDNPRLTARSVRLRRRALRVVLDGRLRTSIDSRLVQTAEQEPLLIMTTSQKAQSAKAGRLRRAGAAVICVRSKGDHLSIAQVLKRLAQRGVTNLLVEGGSAILGSFFDAHLIDEAWVFVSPRLIGGCNAPSSIGGLGVSRMTDCPTVQNLSIKTVGQDRLFQLRFTHYPHVA